ncbi:MAG: hypothetical protein JRF07_10080 [Deltaproteobacteria bacterium]|jgi:hypothetical protein|nr:hypothetical protein [Deltaproteobacteria bacterium]
MDPEWDIDIAMPVMFVLFLSAFLIVGLIPRFERTYKRLRHYFHNRRRSKSNIPNTTTGSLRDSAAFEEEMPSLDYYETVVIKLLADPKHRRISSDIIVAELGLDAEALERVLAQLNNVGLICFVQSPLLIKKYYLSEKGLAYAITQGLVPFPDRRYRKSRYHDSPNANSV